MTGELKFRDDAVGKVVVFIEDESEDSYDLGEGTVTAVGVSTAGWPFVDVQKFDGSMEMLWETDIDWEETDREELMEPEPATAVRSQAWHGERPDGKKVVHSFYDWEHYTINGEPDEEEQARLREEMARRRKAGPSP